MQYTKYLFRLLLVMTLLINIVACSDNNTGANTETVSVTEIPEAIQKLTLTTPGTLRAWIIIDGTRIPMEIDSNTQTATATISGLSRSNHTVSIVYEFTDLNGDIYVLADTAEQNVDLSSGNITLSFDSTDFDTINHDHDGDGVSNAQEVADGTGINDKRCVIGYSLIGKCTL